MSYYEQEQRRYGASGLGGRVTWAVQRLILLNGLVFVSWLVLVPVGYAPGGEWLQAALQLLAFQPSSFLMGFLWQPVTYMFLHAGLWHLAVNMATLFFFGPEVERELGTRQFFRLYVVCGVAGALLAVLTFILFGKDASVVGASGATLGVLAAFVYLDPQRQVFLFPLPVPITALGLMLFIVFLNIISSLDGRSMVSVEAHLGGAGAGFLYMKFTPQVVRAWRRRNLRVVPKAPAKPSERDLPADWDKVGKVVNDILKDKEREFNDRDR